MASTKLLVIFGFFFGAGEVDYRVLHDYQVLDGYTICLDAGHGGQETEECHADHVYTGGTFGVCTGQTEGDVNLDVAFRVKEYLTSLGARVVMTRLDRCRITMGDKTDELSIRPRIANEHNADLFVSIHHNYSTNPNVNYSVMFYGNNRSDESKRLACWLAHFIPFDLGNFNNGIASGRKFTVLKSAKMPSVLIESGFLSNPQEDMELAHSCYRQAEAWAITKGITAYLMSKRYADGIAPVSVDWSIKTKSVKKPVTKKKKKVRKG